MSEYTVTAERAAEWWVLQAVEAPGAISQVAQLDQADEIKEAIAFVTGEPEDSIRVVLTFDVMVSRDGDWWMIGVTALAGVTQARSSEEISLMAREYISAAAGLALDGVGVRLLSA